MDQNQRIYANAYNLILELGPVKLTRLIKKSPDLQHSWLRWTESDYLKIGLDAKTSQAILEARPNIHPQKAFKLLLDSDIDMLTLDDPDYPSLLAEIASPPPLLYIRGNRDCLRAFSLAVVGTRKISPYGRQAVLNLVPELANLHINIVSGMAFGVDAEALHASLDCGLKPIAVLATSLNDSALSPKSNYQLGQRIIEQGCLVSEYAIGSQVQKMNFPIRNRLISGLSIGTLVIEADEKSGALITASYALDQNRSVFAVPGSIFSDVSRGTNQLIKRGAKLVTTAADIVEELNLDLQIIKSTVTLKATETELAILNVISKGPRTLDELIRETKLSAAKAGIALSMLELNGRIKNVGNGTYAKII